MTPAKIAQVAHEINRAYCEAVGDNSQLPWADAPDWQRSSAVNGVMFHLSQFNETGQWPSPDMSHKSWLAEKVADGWTYGEKKDPDKKEHPCMVPYDCLPVEQRVKDYLFGAVVKSLCPNGTL